MPEKVFCNKCGRDRFINRLKKLKKGFYLVYCLLCGNKRTVHEDKIEQKEF